MQYTIRQITPLFEKKKKKAAEPMSRTEQQSAMSSNDKELLQELIRPTEVPQGQPDLLRAFAQVRLWRSVGAPCSPGTIEAADVLIEHARDGSSAILDNNPDGIARARRHVTTAHKQLQEHISIKAEYARLAEMLAARERNENLLKYRDYLNRTLRVVRRRVVRARERGLPRALRGNSIRETAFLDRDWDYVSMDLKDEKEHLGSCLRDRFRPPRPPRQPVTDFVHAVARKYCDYGGNVLIEHARDGATAIRDNDPDGTLPQHTSS